ncbi:MAG: hypothetical protein NTW12_06125 [Deltaproteobacteria bacterium]|nr:hypothetical protein [Deltaproteobacteria bacterium]
MKRIVLSIILVLSVGTGFAFGQDKKDEPTARFVLPTKRALNWSKPVKCFAIASAALFKEDREMEDFKHSKLSIYVKKGTDKLRLWLEGETLTVQNGDQKPDRYQVSGHRNNFLVAVHYGGLVPAVNSIAVNEENGFAVWSLSEPMLVPVSEYPYGQSVYMQCTN